MKQKKHMYRLKIVNFISINGILLLTNCCFFTGVLYDDLDRNRVRSMSDFYFFVCFALLRNKETNKKKQTKTK